MVLLLSFAGFFKAARTTRVAGGPDEVHLRAVARLEGRKHHFQPG